jgi:hypothetical protein
MGVWTVVLFVVGFVMAAAMVLALYLVWWMGRRRRDRPEGRQPGAGRVQRR